MRILGVAVFLLFFFAGAAAPQSAHQKYFLGFDRNDYPGDEAMKSLRREFAFTSYWLGNPPQTKSNSWSDKHEFLKSLGYGFLPLFNGPTSGEVRDEPYTRARVQADVHLVVAVARKEG